MSHDKEHIRLTPRERELTAIGAAIASNCVPCIEYHIPQARKVGLSDLQIREAIELSDKVRKVPADKVLQTAHALLDAGNTPDPDRKDGSCGCSDTEAATAESAECRGRQRDAGNGRADNPSSESDNKPDFDCARMMEMMGRCLPEKMKDISSIKDIMDAHFSKDEGAGP